MLKIALVSTFPPSRGDLNEYSYHLACALRDERDVDLVICGDDIHPERELEGFVVRRCWKFNSLLSAPRILQQLRKEAPDVVWFNMGFSTFANSAPAAFLSTVIPLMARLVGFHVHITLHTVFERISLSDAQVRTEAFYRLGGRIATKLLLMSGGLTVLLPSFREDLLREYGRLAKTVRYRPHGTFGPGEVKVTAGQTNKDPIVLAFGYWGTYKKLDILLDALAEIASAVPSVRLEIGGTNNPNSPGYLEQLHRRWKDDPRVRFLGYVPEEDIGQLFSRAKLMVLPYSSAAGTSGVIRQACQYGLPIVAADIPEFREVAVTDGVAITFYSETDASQLAKRVIELLESDTMCAVATDQNLRASCEAPLSSVVSDYVRQFRQQMSTLRVPDEC